MVIMIMRIITLNGWGQTNDLLYQILPESSIVVYALHMLTQETMQAIAQAGRNAELVIGWSLGGQLAVRAIASGLIKPLKLVLLATPFQFVATAKNPLGMPPDLHQLFRDSFAADPEGTLLRA